MKWSLSKAHGYVLLCPIQVGPAEPTPLAAVINLCQGHALHGEVGSTILIHARRLLKTCTNCTSVNLYCRFSIRVACRRIEHMKHYSFYCMLSRNVKYCKLFFFRTNIMQPRHRTYKKH